MIIPVRDPGPRSPLAAAVALASLVLVSCAATPQSPLGAADARNRLNLLQADRAVAARIGPELREAETAVRIAEQPLPQSEQALGSHRVYLASRKVSVAEMRAEVQRAQAERLTLGDAREADRLAMRTREADLAEAQAMAARREANRARAEASDARGEAQAAMQRAADQADRYQQQIDTLQATRTERGLVLTLGDVLFATGSAALRAGHHSNLDRLVEFLREYPERRVRIEGHTDNVGAVAYNEGLSRRRAESVSFYLAQQGIPAQSLAVAGYGMDRPVADNDTPSGRQQNRRVEVVIENP